MAKKKLEMISLWVTIVAGIFAIGYTFFHDWNPWNIGGNTDTITEITELESDTLKETSISVETSQRESDHYSVPEDIDKHQIIGIKNYAHNKNSYDIKIESISTEILSIEKIEDPVLEGSYFGNPDAFTFVVYNNGWGTAEDIDCELYYSENGETYFQLSEIANYKKNDIVSLNSGEAKELAIGSFNTSDLDTSKNYGIFLGDKEEKKQIIALVYNNADQQWSFMETGGDAGDYSSMSEFTVLDVNKFAGKSITKEHKNPKIPSLLKSGDSFDFYFYFIPTQSCKLTLQTKIEFGDDEPYVSDEFTGRVIVPVVQRTYGTEPTNLEEFTTLLKVYSAEKYRDMMIDIYK